jgi:hypothetical protein
VHNVRNTDVVTAIDDEDCMRLFRLFNEPAGHAFLQQEGIDPETISNLSLLGISCVANLLSAIKTAKYFEFTSDDVILTIATDSAALYQSRLRELNQERGAYTELQAARDYETCMLGTTIDYMKELSYHDKKAIHNLKYFTWVEQQQKDVADLNQLWNDRDIWPALFNHVHRWDELIMAFNERVVKSEKSMS